MIRTHAYVFGAVATICVASPALAGDAVKDLQKHVKKLAQVKGEIESDDPRLEKASELIKAVVESGGVKGAKTLVALTQMTGFASPAIEVTLGELAKEGLSELKDEKARAAVCKDLEKAIKKQGLAVALAEIVSGWPTKASAESLAKLLKSKNDQIVMAGARGLGRIHLRESIKPLIDVYPDWQKRGGKPIEEIGRALYDITLQPLIKAADWEKWWKDSGKDWTPAMRSEADTKGGTKQRPNHFQSTSKVPKFFNSLEVASRKVVIVVDVSGSMHIRQYVQEEIGEEGEAGAKSQTEPKLPAGDPNRDGYKPKPCSFHQCPAARGRKGATCPSDEHLPIYHSRMKRMARAMQRLVKSLPKNTRFNIIAYSTEVRVYKGKALVTASPSNKDKAIEWLGALKAGGTTRSNEAVEQAFKFKEADTIIFVTDGAPTNAAGKPLDEKDVKEFLAEIRSMNRVRKVKVDVVAIAEGHTDFATGLAEQNGGKYVTVD